MPRPVSERLSSVYRYNYANYKYWRHLLSIPLHSIRVVKIEILSAHRVLSCILSLSTSTDNLLLNLSVSPIISLSISLPLSVSVPLYLCLSVSHTLSLSFSLSLSQVLTTGNWPTYKAMDLNLPPIMQRCVQFFQQYYNMEVRMW